MKKKLMIGTVLLLLVVVAGIVLLPHLIDLNRYRDQYLPLAERALGRPADIRNVRLTIFPRLGIRLEGVTIEEDPAFGSAPFLMVPGLSVFIQWLPLLQGRVQVESVFVERPTIHLVRSKSDRMNISTIGPSSSPADDPSADNGLRKGILSVLGVFAVERFSMTGGTLEFEDRFPEVARTWSLEQVEFHTHGVQLQQTASFHGGGLFLPQRIPTEVQGQFGPIQDDLDLPKITVEVRAGNVTMSLEGKVEEGWLDVTLHIPTVSTDDLPFVVPLETPVLVNQVVTHLRAPVLSRNHREGWSSDSITIDPITFDLQSGQSRLAVSGKGTPARLHLKGSSSAFSSQDLPFAVPVKQPFVLEHLLIDADVQGPVVEVSHFRAQAFGGNVAASAVWDGVPAVPAISTKGKFEQFSVESVSGVAGSSSIGMTGKGDLGWAIAGSLPLGQVPLLEGPLRLVLHDGKIVGLDLVEELEKALSMPNQLGPKTGFTGYHMVRADGEFLGKDLALQSLVVEGHVFNSRGSGMIGFDRTLEIRGELILSPTLAGKIVRKYPLAEVALKEESLVIPYVVGGTLGNPSLGLDIKSFGNQVKKVMQERVERVLRGEDKDVQKILKTGEDLLKQLFGR